MKRQCVSVCLPHWPESLHSNDLIYIHHDVRNLRHTLSTTFLFIFFSKWGNYWWVRETNDSEFSWSMPINHHLCKSFKKRLYFLNNKTNDQSWLLIIQVQLYPKAKNQLRRTLLNVLYDINQYANIYKSHFPLDFSLSYRVRFSLYYWRLATKSSYVYLTLQLNVIYLVFEISTIKLYTLYTVS